MLKKILAWALVVSLTAGVAIGGTLAYLTDRDSEANVFTVGDVNIDLNEDFDQGATLIPGVDIVKKPTIKNIGPNAAWVWTTYAIPKALDGHVNLHYSSNNPPVQPTSPDELQDELNVDGATVVLTEDITIDGNTEFMNTASKGVLVEIKDANVVLDMNGHTINVTADAVKDGESSATALFAVRRGSLTVIGKGEINIHNQAIAFYSWTKSDISIYGDITVNSNSYDRKESDLYVNNDDASLHVYAGTYNGYGINVKDSLVGGKLFVGEGVTFGDKYKNLFDADLNRGSLYLEENTEVVNIGPADSPLWQVKYMAGTAEAPTHEFEWIDGGLVGTTTIDGVEYNLYSRLYNTPLASGATTTEDLTRVTLDKRVDITPEGDWYIVDQGVTTPIGWKNSNGNPVIYVSAYAIQAEGFANVSAAYAAYQTQWGDNGAEYAPAVNPIDTAVELEDALASGTPALLAADIVLEQPLSVSQEAYIDLNGHTLTANCLDLKEGGTISNGVFRSDKNNSMLPHLKVNGSDVTLENLTVYINHYMNYGEGMTGGSCVELSGVDVIDGSLVLNNCKLNVTVPSNSAFDETFLYGISVNNGTVTMNGGSIVFGGTFGSKIHCNAVVSGMGTSVVNLNNVNIQNGNCYISYGGNLTINTNVSSMETMTPVSFGGEYTLNYTP